MSPTYADPDTVRKDQGGTVFRVTITDDADDQAVDVSSATTKQIKAKKPDGTIIEKAASDTSDGTDGQIEFTDDSAEFTDTLGEWTYWGYVELPGGWSGDSTALSYIVEEPGS